MAQSSRKLFYHFNWPLFGLILLLLGIGLINLYSATTGREGGVSTYFQSQLLWVLLGILTLLVSLVFHYRRFMDWAIPFYIFSLLFLVLVIFMGKAFGGQQNWLVLGSFRIQPSELAKLALILVLARHFSRHPLEGPSHGKSVWQALGLIAMPLALTLAVKDLGGAVFFVLIGFSFFFFAGMKKTWLLFALALFVLGGFIGYETVLSDYQKGRIQSFLHPEQDPRGRGYQILQSKIAVGSGQVTGKGYTEGSLHKLKFLPERHTDFVFPVLAEEWGFMGSLVVIFGMGAFFLLLLHGAGKVQDPFGAYLIAGMAAWLFWQVLLNLGGCPGLTSPGRGDLALFKLWWFRPLDHTPRPRVRLERSYEEICFLRFKRWLFGQTGPGHFSGPTRRSDRPPCHL